MRRFIFLLFIFSTQLSYSVNNEINNILLKLNEAIANEKAYVAQKEQDIYDIKQMLKEDMSPEQAYFINNQLYLEYKSFRVDSAIVYTNKNIELAKQLSNKEWLYDSTLDLITLYSLSAMFNEALDAFTTIPLEEVSKNLQIKYYESYKRFYDYYSQEFNENRLEGDYDFFSDILLELYPSTAPGHLMLRKEKLIKAKKYDEALKLLLDEFNKCMEEDAWKAVLSYSIGEVYRLKGDTDMQKKYFAISAISDVKNAIKENASLTALAIVCYESGDRKNAYKYFDQSVQDAIFSNSYLRILEITRMFPVLEKSYADQMDGINRTIRTLNICIFVLAALLIGMSVYCFRKKKSLNR